MTPSIHIGAAPDAFHAFADLVDGHSALVHRVELSIEPAMLTAARRGAEDLVISKPDGAVLRWPLRQLRTPRGQAGDDTLVIASADDPLARLYVTDRQAQDILGVRAPRMARAVPVPGRLKLMGWAIAALASVALIVFQLVPLLADRLALYVPPAGEQALGEATFEQIRGALGDGEPLALCEAPAGRAALEQMIARLGAGRGLAYPLKVHVLDGDTINAFALPGGHVVIFRGLIDAAEEPEEVGAVFAHELGHVAGRDPTRAALRTAGSIGVLGLLLGDFAGGAAVLMLTEQLISANYSQTVETAADAYALRLLADADLSPGALGRMFDRLSADGGDVDGPLSYLLSHPRMKTRIAAAEVAEAADAAGAGGPRRPLLLAGQWEDMRAICTRAEPD